MVRPRGPRSGRLSAGVENPGKEGYSADSVISFDGADWRSV